MIRMIRLHIFLLFIYLFTFNYNTCVIIIVIIIEKSRKEFYNKYQSLSYYLV